MPIRSLLIIISLFILLPATTVAKVKQKKLKLKTAKQIKIPKSIDLNDSLLKLDKSTRFDNLSLGAVIKYEIKEHPDLVISYYIYPMNELNIPVEYLMSVQHELLKSEIKHAHEINGGKTVLLEESLENVGNRFTFYNKHNIVSEKGDLISESYLTHNKFHYLKLRMSYPRFHAKEYNTLSNTIANQLILNTTVKEKKNTDIAINLSGSIGDELKQTIFLMQLGYLSKLKEHLNTENLITSYEQILSTLKYMVELSENWVQKTGKLENLLYIHEIKQAGFLEEFAWTAMNQPHWTEPDGLEINRFEEWFIPHKDKINPISPEFGMLSVLFD